MRTISLEMHVSQFPFNYFFDVIPAQMGIQVCALSMRLANTTKLDSRLRGNDDSHGTIQIKISAPLRFTLISINTQIPQKIQKDLRRNFCVICGHCF